MTEQLERTLGPVMLWGLGVGYVISGMYFGWNLGLVEGGTLGLAIATIIVAIMYLTFTLSYTELACAMPRAGGAFTYAYRAFGPMGGFIGGLSQLIEFVFAPPAIAAGIGAYLNLFFPEIPVTTIAIGAFVVFTLLNLCGVQAAALFELVVTVIAVLGLLLFSGLTLPSFQWSNMQLDALPNGWLGVFAAMPFALWFFLAIEGIANVAEETVNPQKNVLRGFSSSMLTLVVLCGLTFAGAVGVNGWPAIVVDASDSPLPLALSHLMQSHHILYQSVIVIGIFGLVASFHGILLIASRASFEMGRQGFAPQILGRINHRFKTPGWALLLNMLIGIAALFSGKTGEMIILACFGALTLYIISILALFKLRQSEPNMERPYRTPFYPYFPAVAFIIAIIALISMSVYHQKMAMIFYAILATNAFAFQLFLKPKLETAS